MAGTSLEPIRRGAVTLAVVLATGCSASADSPELRELDRPERFISASGDAAPALESEEYEVLSARPTVAQADAPPPAAEPLPIADIDPATEEPTAHLPAPPAATKAPIVPEHVTASDHSHDWREPVTVQVAATPSLHPPEQLRLAALEAGEPVLDWQSPDTTPVSLKTASAATPERPTAVIPVAAGFQPPAAPAIAALDPRVEIEQIAPFSRQIYMVQVAGEGAVLMAVRSGNEVIGQVQFQVSAAGIGVHIGQVLDLFRDRMDGTQFARLRGSQAAQTFVSLDKVRSAGVPLDYDPVYDELVLGGRAEG